MAAVRLLPRFCEFQRTNHMNHFGGIFSLFIRDGNLYGGRSPYGQTNWPDILRSTATMVAGIMPPSQLLKKFASHPRQHDLVIALREIGRVARTLFIIDWLLDGVRVKYETARPRGNITAWRALISWPPSLSIGTQISLVRPLHGSAPGRGVIPTLARAEWSLA